MSDLSDLVYELRGAHNNLIAHQSGRIHQKYGPGFDTVNCPKCISTLTRLIDAVAGLLASEALTQALASVEKVRRFSAELGFGDGVTEPAASLSDLVDPLKDALSAAEEHIGCPITCELCGDILADTVCEHCHGSGCGPGTASGAYAECEWCAGAGKVHPGCVEMSYKDLAEEHAKALATIEKAEAWALAEQDAYLNGGRVRPAGLLSILDEETT